MEGLVELAEEVFHIPVRLGLPQRVSGLSDVVQNPIYSTGVGLLLYGKQQQKAQNNSSQSAKSFDSLWQKMKSWFGRF